MMEPLSPNLNTNQNQGVPIKNAKNAKAEEEAQKARLNNFKENLFKIKTSQYIRDKLTEKGITGKSGTSHFDKLPRDVLGIITKNPHLTHKDLGQLRAASKALSTSEALEEGKIMASIIGAEEYKRLLNVEVDDLPIPRELIEYLKSPSVIDPKVPTMAKTMVVLIPKTMKTKDDEAPKPTTLNSYKEMIEKVMREKFGSSFYGSINSQILEQYGDRAIEESFYLVMTTEVLPGTTSKPYADYAEQLEIAQKYDYEPPSVLSAFIGITMRFLKTGVTHYGQEPAMYTHCKEVVDGVDGYQIVVGWVGASGFEVHPRTHILPLRLRHRIGLAGVGRRSFF